jgi:hypothetical protein
MAWTFAAVFAHRSQANALPEAREGLSPHDALACERWAKTSARRKAAGAPLGRQKSVPSYPCSSVQIGVQNAFLCVLRVFVVFFGCGLRLRCVSVLFF